MNRTRYAVGLILGIAGAVWLSSLLGWQALLAVTLLMWGDNVCKTATEKANG